MIDEELRYVPDQDHDMPDFDLTNYKPKDEEEDTFDRDINFLEELIKADNLLLSHILAHKLADHEINLFANCILYENDNCLKIGLNLLIDSNIAINYLIQNNIIKIILFLLTSLDFSADILQPVDNYFFRYIDNFKDDSCSDIFYLLPYLAIDNTTFIFRLTNSGDFYIACKQITNFSVGAKCCIVQFLLIFYTNYFNLIISDNEFLHAILDTMHESLPNYFIQVVRRIFSIIHLQKETHEEEDQFIFK